MVAGGTLLYGYVPTVYRIGRGADWAPFDPSGVWSASSDTPSKIQSNGGPRGKFRARWVMLARWQPGIGVPHWD